MLEERTVFGLFWRVSGYLRGFRLRGGAFKAVMTTALHRAAGLVAWRFSSEGAGRCQRSPSGLCFDVPSLVEVGMTGGEPGLPGIFNFWLPGVADWKIRPPLSTPLTNVPGTLLFENTIHSIKSPSTDSNSSFTSSGEPLCTWTRSQPLNFRKDSNSLRRA